MKDLKHPANHFLKLIRRHVTILPNEESEEEDYHMVTEANRQLHRQSSQNSQSLNDNRILRRPRYDYFDNKTT